jgi:hypothetical protein
VPLGAARTCSGVKVLITFVPLPLPLPLLAAFGFTYVMPAPRTSIGKTMFCHFAKRTDAGVFGLDMSPIVLAINRTSASEICAPNLPRNFSNVMLSLNVSS